MEYQSFGRPLRPKGANPKQALKVILVFAVCAWLVYQIKHSTNKTRNYSGQPTLVVGYGAVSLGRKVNPSSALPDSKNVDSAVEATESSSGREDKDEEEFGHVNGKFGTKEQKEMEHEPESQPTKRSVVNDSQSNDEELEEQQLREPTTYAQIRKNDKSDFSGKNETRTQESVVKSATNASTKDRIDEVLSFLDENGVPPDGDEIQIVAGQAHILHEESISNEVTPGEDNNVEVNFEGSKNDATADEEFNSGNFTLVDTSGINSKAEVGEGDSQAL